MAISSWIDAIAEKWGQVSDGRGGQVRSYAAFKRSEFPEALSVSPCALTYITGVPVVQYSLGGPCVVVYQGVTEFHLTRAVDKSLMPYVMGYYERIIAAAASSITLGGLVEHWLLSGDEPIKPGVLTYAGEDPHYGMVVNWRVKELLTLTVGV
mgnify:FL=1